MTETNEPTTPEADAVVTAEEFMDLKKQLGAAKIQLDDTVTAKDAEITALKEQVEAFQQKEKDSQWELFAQKLPTGFVHNDETKAASRAKWEENPQMFMIEVMDAMKQAPESKEEGQQFMQQGKASDDDKTVDKELAELGYSII